MLAHCASDIVMFGPQATISIIFAPIHEPVIHFTRGFYPRKRHRERSPQHHFAYGVFRDSNKCDTAADNAGVQQADRHFIRVRTAAAGSLTGRLLH